MIWINNRLSILKNNSNKEEDSFLKVLPKSLNFKWQSFYKIKSSMIRCGAAKQTK